MHVPKKSVQTSKTVSVPTKLLTSLIDAHESWSRANDELEDYLLASNSALIAKIRKAKKEAETGQVVDLAQLKKRLLMR